ncbi:hypothetical protein niasHS_006511 [Heterodera schachtii]|uniref:Uncharacterized protein n=2 Tax=Heterodera TaxID=34509 RepID=A0ABD2JHG0_HETSC
MPKIVPKQQIGANVFNMMLSFCLLLALSSAELLPATLGVALFVGLASLAVSSVAVAMITSGLHWQVAKFGLFHAFAPYGEIQWRHLQFTYAVALASSNGIGFLLNWAIASSLPRPFHRSYSIAAFFSLALCLSFLLTALLATHDLSDEADMEQKTTLVRRQEQQSYTEL